MKRLLSVLISTLFVFGSFSVSAFSAGSWDLTESGSQPGSKRMWKQYTCTADAADGSVPALTVTGFYDFYLFTIETWPGGTSPSDATDFTLSDATTGEDLLGGTGADSIDATSTITLVPYSVGMDLFYTPIIKGDLTLTITNNSVNSAIINIRITGVK